MIHRYRGASPIQFAILHSEEETGVSIQEKNATTQDESEITIAPKIQKSDANINWLTDSAKIIYNKFRAFGDKIPPKTTFRSGKKTVGIQFISLSLPADNEAAELQKFMSANATPGSLYLASKNPKYFITTCADGSLLKVDKVKVDGKNIVGVTDFVNGYSVVSEQFAFT
ncbi:Methionyl-tRNA formyltransferase [Zancudomyces culisetae]|uniref:Methionyl-tRNA formyltransferase n=1 Tax=Zancudomyces culisetae TaxID=1213189 RepID=A0A1R1PRV5_ZANCU|nr:Methionyl-tRNA formyltransferase [Zancudomyces culisetae]|eukprot:OMH83622.1 Methionyl-tRNA formyltransferase [Zancudomyces culisetae]